MSADKENVKPQFNFVKPGSSSKIPVPLSRANSKQDSPKELIRDPLITLANSNSCQNIPGSSRDLVPSIHVDTKYVTYRDNDNKELDWKYQVFQGSYHVKPLVREENQRPAQTPAPPSVEKKKVKKGLKRAHSMGVRESPPSGGDKVSPPLLHNLEAKRTGQKYKCRPEVLVDSLSKFYAADNLKHLLKTEKRMLERPNIRSASRACVINWLVKVQSSHDNPAVVQLACWYMDKYLSSTWVAVSRLQVIAAACFWIATKFHSKSVTSKRLVKFSGHAFVEVELIAAERNVLRKLNFPGQSVVPHDFVSYLSCWCGWAHSSEVEAAASFICLAALMVDKTLHREFPSVIAAAAVRISLALLEKTVCMELFQSCPVYKEAVKKSRNFPRTCDLLYHAIKVVRSAESEYKAVVCKYAGPPSYIVNRIFKSFQNL